MAGQRERRDQARLEWHCLDEDQHNNHEVELYSCSETVRMGVRRGPMCGLMTATEEETKSGPSTQAFDLDFKKYFDFIEYRSGLQHLVFL